MISALAITGCSKNTKTEEIPSYDSTILAMTAKAMDELSSQKVYAGLPGTGLFMDNDGLPCLFLADEYDLDGNDPVREKIRTEALVRCLKAVDLNATQKEKARSAFHEYKECNAASIERAKAIYRELQSAYREKYKRIYNAYQAGQMTEREFTRLVEALKAEFRRELHSLYLKEKLDQALLKCLRSLLSELKSILTEEQWREFSACYLKT